ncbi:translation initiation factor IF-2-like [Nycticebus coucang]|uniref:translation initiation factor IF-2-like n=1 Tax=Nycticebus coucang TaxID=9470 RepID=UPI00234D03D5|nr:translation initiation factor IF-2-like [Nycticebus coucang]
MAAAAAARAREGGAGRAGRRDGAARGPEAATVAARAGLVEPGPAVGAGCALPTAAPRAAAARPRPEGGGRAGSARARLDRPGRGRRRPRARGAEEGPGSTGGTGRRGGLAPAHWPAPGGRGCARGPGRLVGVGRLVGRILQTTAAAKRGPQPFCRRWLRSTSGRKGSSRGLLVQPSWSLFQVSESSFARGSAARLVSTQAGLKFLASSDFLLWPPKVLDDRVVGQGCRCYLMSKSKFSKSVCATPGPKSEFTAKMLTTEQSN